jgi:hypothetical protein
MDYPTTGTTEFNTVNETSIRISATVSTAVVSARSTRTYLRIFNDGTDDICLGLGTTANTSRGLRIAAGTSWVSDRDNIWRGTINAIAATAADTERLYILEGYVS